MAGIIGGYDANSYLQSIQKNMAREKEIRRMYGYTDKDYVTIHTLPKGQKTKRYASFGYTPMTARAKRLQSQVYSLKGQIAKTMHAAMPAKEKAKKLHSLRSQLKYASGQFSTEMASAPKVGCIVLEEDESQE